MMDMKDLNITGIEDTIFACMYTAAELGIDFYHFLDSFSPSQLESKTWLVDALSLMDIDNPKIQLFGGWNGILITRLLIQNLNIKRIHNIDLDEKSINIFKKYREETKDKRLDGTHGDVRNPHKYDASTNVVINTSSEHMPDLPELIKNKTYKENCIFAIQSNNMFHIPDHINCVNSEDELIKKCQFKKVFYSSKLSMKNGYERYMVIGRY